MTHIPLGWFLARILIVTVTSFSLVACGGGGGSASAGTATESSPSGSPIPATPVIEDFTMNPATTVAGEGACIDLSRMGDGVAMASATDQPTRLKLTVTCGEMTYAYDLPADGMTYSAPANMGDGHYWVRVMRNIEGSEYVEILSAEADVTLSSEFAPFLVPNMMCSFSGSSGCVIKAREIASSCSNQGELAEGICKFVMETLEYDKAKAAECATSTGYVPLPDRTLGEGKGICFDYASLNTAMFRSVGIPAKLVTGYVQPDNIYHSWVEAYVDGQWRRYGLSVNSGKWSLLDVTMADSADGDESALPAVSDYTVRFVY